VCLEPARTFTSAQRFMEYWLTHCATISPTGSRVYISSTSEIWRKLIVTEAKTYGDSRLRTQDNLYHDLAKVGRRRHSSDTKSDVAERHGLRVVRGRIPVPDLRIEYRTLNTNSLGLTSNLRNLRPITAGFKNIVQKIGAGFAIYARAQHAPNLGRVLEQLEITSEILDL
jgi:hypothetical protein